MNVNRLYGVLIAVAIVAIAIPVYAQSSGTTKEEKAETDTVTGKQLEEVTVTADAKTVTVDGFKTTIQIAGTAYDVAGSVIDLLPYLPGMTRTAGGLEVRGYGTPVYVIDGKRVTDMRQISMLQVDRVSKVTIDTNPEMEYASEARAVVYVTTRKTLYDTVSLRLGGFVGKRRRWNWEAGPTLFAKLGKFTTQLGYDYNNYKSLLKETYFREIDRTGNGDSFFLSQPRKWFTNSFSHGINWSLDWDIATGHSMTLYYFYDHGKYNTHIKGFNEISQGAGGDKIYQLDKSTETPSNTHSVSLMYYGKWGKSVLKIYQDVAFLDIKGRQHIDETDLATDAADITDINSRSKYNIYTSRVNYQLLLPWDLYFLAGGSYQYIDADNRIGSDNLDWEYGQYKSVNTSDEHYGRGYIGLFRIFGPLTAQVNGIYSYLFRKTVSKSAESQSKPVKERHSEINPSVTLILNCGRGFRITGDYYQSRTLPNFSEINSGLVYTDAYAYSVGNPELRSSMKRTWRLAGSWRALRAYVRYSRVDNPMIDVETPLEEGSNIVKQWKTNMYDSDEWEISASWSKFIKGVNMSVDGWVDFPNYKIPESTRIRHIKDPYWGCSLNLSYCFNDHFSAFTDYSFTSRRWLENGRWEPMHQWNLSINGSFFSDRLKLTLQFTDILNKEHYSNCSYFYENVSWGTRGRSDMRGVRLTVSYTLFNKEINTKARNYNETELMRTSE